MADEHARLPLLTDDQWSARQPRRGRRRRGGPPLLVRISRRAVLFAAATTIGVSAAVMVVHASHSQEVARSTSLAPPAPADLSVTLASQSVVPGSSFAPLTIEIVRARTSASASASALTLVVRTARSTDLLVTLRRRGADLRERSISLGDRGVHRIQFADLPPGPVTWLVRAPDEDPRTGRVRISPPVPPAAPEPGVPEPAPIPSSPVPDAPVTPTTPPTPDRPGTTEGAGEPKDPTGTGGTGGRTPPPRDPDTDEPIGPIDPDDPASGRTAS